MLKKRIPIENLATGMYYYRMIPMIPEKRIHYGDQRTHNIHTNNILYHIIYYSHN